MRLSAASLFLVLVTPGQVALAQSDPLTDSLDAVTTSTVSLSRDAREWLDLSLPLNSPRVHAKAWGEVISLVEVTGDPGGVPERPGCGPSNDGDKTVLIDSYWWDVYQGGNFDYALGVPVRCNGLRGRWEPVYDEYVWVEAQSGNPNVSEWHWVDGYGEMWGDPNYTYTGGAFRTAVDNFGSCKAAQIFGGPGVRVHKGHVIEAVVQLNEIATARAGISAVIAWVNILPPNAVVWDVASNALNPAVTDGFGFFIDRGVVKAFTARNGSVSSATLYDMPAACAGANDVCGGRNPQDNALTLALRMVVTDGATPAGQVGAAWKEGAAGAQPWTDTPNGTSVLGWQAQSLPGLVGTFPNPEPATAFAYPVYALCNAGAAVGANVNTLSLKKVDLRVKEVLR